MSERIEASRPGLVSGLCPVQRSVSDVTQLAMCVNVVDDYTQWVNESDIN